MSDERVAPSNISPGIQTLAREMREEREIEPTYTPKYTVEVDSVDKSYLYVVAECDHATIPLGPIAKDHEEFEHEGVMKWRFVGENWPSVSQLAAGGLKLI